MDTKPPFENIVASHGTAVLRVCRAVLGSHTDADDAWSETFLAAMRAYAELPTGANVLAWLVTIAHRKAIDVIRGRRRLMLHTDMLTEQPSGTGDPGQTDYDLWAYVRALPDKQRMAVSYHYVAGLPYKEVAAILGGTTDAARRAAADGIASLRTALAESTPEGAAR